jgi:hypothetical protein
MGKKIIFNEKQLNNFILHEINLAQQQQQLLAQPINNPDEYWNSIGGEDLDEFMSSISSDYQDFMDDFDETWERIIKQAKELIERASDKNMAKKAFIQLFNMYFPKQI